MAERGGTLPLSAFDLPKLLARLDNDHSFVRALLEIFMEEFPRLMQSLREAIVRRDSEEIAIRAHTLKGMLSNVSFTPAASCAARLERMAQQNLTEGLQEETAKLEQCASLALTKLQEFCAETQL